MSGDCLNLTVGIGILYKFIHNFQTDLGANLEGLLYIKFSKIVF